MNFQRKETNFSLLPLEVHLRNLWMNPGCQQVEKQPTQTAGTKIACSFIVPDKTNGSASFDGSPISVCQPADDPDVPP